MTEDRSTLKPGEPHPCASYALEYIRKLSWNELAILQESLSSCAIEGNRLAEVCGGTLRRLMNHEPVSDRYVLALAWMVRDWMEEREIDQP